MVTPAPLIPCQLICHKMSMPKLLSMAKYNRATMVLTAMGTLGLRLLFSISFIYFCSSCSITIVCFFRPCKPDLLNLIN